MDIVIKNTKILKVVYFIFYLNVSVNLISLVACRSWNVLSQNDSLRISLYPLKVNKRFVGTVCNCKVGFQQKNVHKKYLKIHTCRNAFLLQSAKYFKCRL